MKHFLAVMLVWCVSVAFAHAADILEVTDVPEFATQGQNLWGLDQASFSKTFDNKVTDISFSGGDNRLWGAEIDNEVAIFTGTTQFLCPEGSFIDPFTDDCYTCPDGFSHDPLKNVNDAGVCFRRHSETTADPGGAVQFICPAGSFLDLASGGCYSCPSGYTHNPLLPANVPGVCSVTNTEPEHVAGHWACRAGEFSDAGSTGCYTCPSGYDHNPLLTVDTNGVCHQSGTSTRRARDCGDGHKCAIGEGGWPVATSCAPSGCPSAIRRSPLSLSDFKWFSCDGWNHNPLFSLSDNRVCFTAFSNSSTATFQHSQSCGSGEVKNILDGNCYACPPGYTNILGTCTLVDNTVANFDENPGLLCGADEFLSGDACYSCPAGKRHDFLLPAFVEGVCYESEDLTAEAAGNQSLLCPADSFLNVADGLCYRCPDGYNWNPLLLIDQPGVCSKMVLTENASNPSFEVGYDISADFHYQQGWTGGVTVDSGSIDVQYSPTITLSLAADGTASEGWPIYQVSVTQAESSSLAMQTSWAKANVFLDQWTDAGVRADASFIYPELDPDTLQYNQKRDDITLWDADSGGRATLAANPLIEAEVSNTIIGVRLLGLPVDAAFFFDPPYEITKDIANAGNLSIGFVVAEMGLQVPLLNTPVVDRIDLAGNSVPFNADYNETVATGNSNAATYIQQTISAGERTGFRLFVPKAGLKDNDIGRFDLDIDGLIALATNTPLGLKLSQKKFKLTLWSISQDLVDLTFGGVVAFDTDYSFHPNLDIILSFSLAVWPVNEDGSLGLPVNEMVAQPGVPVRFAHPGGELQISTAYSLRNNEFVNDTDLTLTSLLSGDVLAYRMTILGVPASLLPSQSLLHIDAELNPEPFKLMDMNFLDDSSAARFNLDGFDDIAGSTLIVSEEIPIAASCQDFSVALDADGIAGIIPQDIDAGSQASTGTPVLSVSRTQFSCADLGVNAVSLTASSTAGASKSCSASVTVSDTIIPVLQLPPTVRAEAVDASGASVSLDYSATDNCSITLTQTPAGEHFPLGDTTVEVTATDTAGNQSSGSFVVSVVDTLAPVVVAPAAVIVEATDELTPVALGIAMANDLVDGIVMPFVDSIGPFAVGTHRVVWTAGDTAGNSASASQQVTVVDTTAPVLQVPTEIEIDATGALTNVSINDVRASDIFDVSLRSDAPAAFPVGITPVNWTATDSNGNRATATTRVNIIDRTAPVVSARSGVALTGDLLLRGIERDHPDVQAFIDSASALDAVDGELAVNHNIPPFLPLGESRVIFSSVDTAGNAGEYIAVITVNDPVASGLDAPAASGTGLTIKQSMELGLDPDATTTDTDGDGIDDNLEIGDPANPNDSDGDGVLDVFETGDAADDASMVSGLAVEDTRVDIESDGQNLSQVSSGEAGPGAPEGVEFPFGIISYQTTVAEVGDSQTVRLSFERPLPDALVLYKVDNTGVYSQIPENQWQIIDAFTVALTITDGGVFDLDAEANGIIVDPVAVGSNPSRSGSVSMWMSGSLFLLLSLLRCGRFKWQ